MKASSDYWAAMTQVLPVVALAIVLEIRLVVSRWNEGFPRWLRALQSTLWAGILAVLAFGETNALRALRGDKVASWWPAACEIAVGCGMGILIISPALEILVRANAEIVARLVAAHPLVRLKSWRLHLQANRYMRLTERELRHHEFKLYYNMWRLTQMEKWQEEAASLAVQGLDQVAESERGRVRRIINELPGLRAELASIRDDVQGSILDLRERFKAFHARKAETLSKRQRWREDWRSFNAKEREELNKLLRAFDVSEMTSGEAITRRLERAGSDMNETPVLGNEQSPSDPHQTASHEARR
ncbi:hypothetical protein [Petropleomorpha daqingensis]|uniref:Uncharacterized protein n=1 Tax=Petropleomorpha daqingensis TaxID=2026353 RepID=A0A853CGL0_9ACTN|nr:hypothetical protein [Petropleomorpha daqingensis]NYJ06587.1 hypothetical protein [Petropleomorpha daqingensis]